ncbi:MAG: DUF5693 family protein [Bacillota bacterium]|nr:DUF5693 family protein [Bacillota bacterium]
MKGKLKLILWICLAISLIGSFSGFRIRYSNENNSHSVVAAADYYDFLKVGNSAHINFNDLLARMKSSGINTVSVREETLGDLAYRGDIYLSTVGEYLSDKNEQNSAIYGSVKSTLSSGSFDAASIIAVTSDPSVAAFLSDSLGRRFNPKELVKLSSGAVNAFIMNPNFTVSTDVGLNNLDAPEYMYYINIGFDTKALDRLKGAGMSIILHPRNSPGSNTAYLSEYEGIIKSYDVKTLVFDGSAVPGAPDNLDVFKNIINSNKLVVGVVEAPTQVGIISPAGLDKLSADINYTLQRVYSNMEIDLKRIPSDEFFFRWERSVVDRNIRIVDIDPFLNPSRTFSQNIDDTLQISKQFTDFISSKGYSIDKPLARFSSEMPGKLHYTMMLLNLLFAFLLYLAYLVPVKGKVIAVLTALGVLVSLGAGMVMGIRLAQYIALAASILYPSFANLLIYVQLRNNSDKKGFARYIPFVFIMFVVNMLGAYSVVSSVADVTYSMNIGIFRGVTLTYIIPMLLFILNFIACFVGLKGLDVKIRDLMKRSITYLVAVLALVIFAAVFIYLTRSGNNTVVKPSQLELKMREILEKVMVIRPREKEFLIGYPALFVLVYLYRRYKSTAIAFILGAGVTIGCVSIVNSFCHVFADISVSFRRGVNGLIIGTVVGIAAVAVVSLFLRLYNRHALRTGKRTI